MSDKDLWERICETPRPHKVVDFPRNGEDGKPIGQIAMWVLTQLEQEACAANAYNKARALIRDGKGEIPKDSESVEGFRDLRNNIAADEVLYRACRKVGDLNQSAFPSPDKLREKLSVDEVGVLMTHYYSVQEELGPIVAHMSNADMEALIGKLQRSGDRFPLDLLSRELLTRLLLFSVSQIPSSSTDTSSLGKQQGESTSSVSPAGEGDFDAAGGAPQT